LNNDDIKFVNSTLKYALSFNKAVETVARERKYLATINGFNLEATQKFIQMVEEKNLAQFYAIKDDEVIGWCDIIPKSQEGFKHTGVLGMGVIKEFRGRGIGKTLIIMALKHAKEVNGLEIVKLEVFESNMNALKLYEKMGFSVEGRKLKARKLDGVYDNIILMSKEF